MWRIDPDTNKITMTRGDTPTFKVNLTITDPDGNVVPYTPSEGDEIIFIIKKRATDDEKWAIVNVPTDTMELRFKQETTKALDFGDYMYELSINNEGMEYHCTFIQAPITLKEELY